MPLSPNFFLGLLTPHTPVGQAPNFDAVNHAIDNVRAARQHKAALAAQKNQSDVAQKRLELDIAKFQQKTEQKRREQFAAAMEQAGPELQSGAPNRVDPALGALRAAGGSVEGKVLGHPAEYQAVLAEPGMDGQFELDMDAYRDKTPRPSLDIPALSVEGMQPEVDPTEEPLGRPYLMRHNMEFPPELTGTVLQTAEDTQHEGYEIRDPFGNVVQEYDQQATLDENVQTVADVLGGIAQTYLGEYAPEADMLLNIAEDATNTALASEGGKVQDAIKYATDLFMDAVGIRAKNARAEIMAAATGNINKYTAVRAGEQSGIQAMQRSEVVKRRHDVQNMSESLQALEEGLKTGSMDTLQFIRLVYAITKSNESGGRISDQDFKINMGLSTLSERVKNWLGKNLSLTPEQLQSELAASDPLYGNAKVSRQTMLRFSNFVIDRLENMRKLQEDAKARLRKQHASLQRGGSAAMANGFAHVVNSEFEDLLPVVTPDDYMARQQMQQRRQQQQQQTAGENLPPGYKPSPDDYYGPPLEDTVGLAAEGPEALGAVHSGQPDPEAVKAAQATLDRLTGASKPGVGYQLAQLEVQAARAAESGFGTLPPAKRARIEALEEAMQAFDEANAINSPPPPGTGGRLRVAPVPPVPTDVPSDDEIRQLLGD